MTKEDFIKKYIYGIGNDALTDNQEAIDMAEDLDRYFAEQLRQHNAVRRGEQFKCEKCGSDWGGVRVTCFNCNHESEDLST